MLLKKDNTLISDTSYHTLRGTLGESLASLFPTLNSVKERRSEWNAVLNEYLQLSLVAGFPGYEVSDLCLLLTLIFV